MVREIKIYGNIGYDWWTGEGITAKSISKELDAAIAAKEKEVTVRINSPGGSVFEGIAIYNAIANSALEVTTIVDGIAYSMGAIIALAGNKIQMAKNATMMIHNVSGGVYGNANDLRGALEMMEKLDNSLAISISDKTGLSVDEVKSKWLDFVDHTLSADEALKDKLIDSIVEGKNTSSPKNFTTVQEAQAFFTVESQKQFITNQIQEQFNSHKTEVYV